MDSTYVRSGHLHSSGYIRKARTVVKAMDVVGSASAGLLGSMGHPNCPSNYWYLRYVLARQSLSRILVTA